MYGYNQQANIERLKRQREEIDALINNYQQMPQQPITNVINQQPTQNVNTDMFKWRVLNDNEEVDNTFVDTTTLFVGDTMMIKKDVNGELQKWEIKKIYPIDKKDERINQLEEEIKKLKEMMKNEHSKSNKSNVSKLKSDVNVDGNAESEPTTSSE